MSHRLIARAAACALLLGFAFTASASPSETAPGATDTAFMKHAAADGMAEVRMGQMALEKSASADVKKLAQRIVTDHTSANAKLKTIAQAQGVSLPASPGAEAQQKAATLDALDGQAFDQAWAAAMVKDHQKAVEMFSAETRNSGDSPVQNFASDTLPTLKAHLELAQRLQGSLGQPTGGTH